MAWLHTSGRYLMFRQYLAELIGEESGFGWGQNRSQEFLEGQRADLAERESPWLQRDDMCGCLVSAKRRHASRRSAPRPIEDARCRVPSVTGVHATALRRAVSWSLGLLMAGKRVSTVDVFMLCSSGDDSHCQVAPGLHPFHRVNASRAVTG